MFLQRWRQTWIAVHTIPPGLRQYFDGAAKLKKSTGESDKSRAEVVASQIFVTWRKQIFAAKQARKGDTTGMDLATVERELGWDDLFDDRPGGQRLEELITPWLASIVGDQPKTLHMKKSDGELFAARFVTARKVTKKAVQEWIDGEIATGAAVATLRRKLSNLRGFWDYLISHDVVSDENRPLDRPRLPKSKATAVDVRPFTTAEVVDLAGRARDRKDQELVDFIAIAAFTGARIEEIATLEIRHILKADIVLPGVNGGRNPRDSGAVKKTGP